MAERLRVMIEMNATEAEIEADMAECKCLEAHALAEADQMQRYFAAHRRDN